MERSSRNRTVLCFQIVFPSLTLRAYLLRIPKLSDEFVYGQESNQSQYPHIDDGLDSEFHGNSNLDLVDMPLNLTVLEHNNNKTIYNNTVKSSTVNQDSSI